MCVCDSSSFTKPCSHPVTFSLSLYMIIKCTILNEIKYTNKYHNNCIYYMCLELPSNTVG